MNTLITSTIKSFGSLGAPGLGWVFIKSIIITVIALIAFIFLATAGAGYVVPMIENEFIREILPWFAGIGATIIAWMLFPGIMPFITSFFNDEIIEIIERKDYPSAAKAGNSFISDIIFDTKFGIKALLLNLLVLPLYLIPVVNLFVYLSLNGYLLGSQFFLSVARRHMPTSEAVDLERKNSHIIFVSGVAIAFFAIVPLINLVIPFLGIAVMTHIFHAEKDSLTYQIIK